MFRDIRYIDYGTCAMNPSIRWWSSKFSTHCSQWLFMNHVISMGCAALTNLNHQESGIQHNSETLMGYYRLFFRCSPLKFSRSTVLHGILKFALRLLSSNNSRSWYVQTQLFIAQ